MMFSLCLLLLATSLLTNLAQSENVVISLSPGQQLRGLKVTRPQGDDVYKFLGIPYAEPPTGNGRFAAPVSLPAWTGVRDAVKESNICLQGSNPKFTVSEDCLYLNVFSSNLTSSLPVLVWIHGGGYRAGSAYNDGDGVTLAPRGIVVVTINYRLGPLGYASLEDDIMPGNYGMLDQILALRWVWGHIKSFGGDPRQLTIAGESAGAYSVSLLTYSPLARGLFQRVIMESGSALSSDAVERPKRIARIKEFTLSLADLLGCQESTSVEILNCLRQVDADRLNKVQSNVTVGRLSVRLEDTFGFLSDFPLNLLRQGKYSKVDTLVGANSGERCSAVKDPTNDGVTRQELDSFDFMPAYADGAHLSNRIRDAYFGNETDPIQIRTDLLHATSDFAFSISEVLELEKTLSNPNTSTRHYLYEFDYRASTTTTPAWCGVSHAAERQFVFFDDSIPSSFTSTDRAVADVVQSMWANFIKYGEPTPADSTDSSGNKLPTWKEYTTKDRMMMIIDEKLTIVPFPRPFAIPLYEQFLDFVNSDLPSAVVG